MKCISLSISVIVKHVQHIGIIGAFCLPGGTCYVFSVPGATEKITGLRFTREGSVPKMTL